MRVTPSAQPAGNLLASSPLFGRGPSSGGLGNNSTTNSPVPIQVQGLTAGVSAITAGGYYTCALVSGGAQCWGNSDKLAPVPVQGLTSGVTAITAGCAVVNNGAQCWGANSYGQLGNGTTIDSLTPVQVQFP